MNSMNPETRKKLRIIVPILILIAIIGVWFLKNANKFGNESSTASNAANPDFALVAETLDLEKLKSHNLPIILDFGSEFCMPCQEMAPTLKKLNKEMQGKAIIRVIDVAKNKETAAPYPINMVPTQIFFDAEGNPYQPKNLDPKLAAQIEMLSKSAANADAGASSSDGASDKASENENKGENNNNNKDAAAQSEASYSVHQGALNEDQLRAILKDMGVK